MFINKIALTRIVHLKYRINQTNDSMKNKIFLFAFVSVFALVSCDKNDDSDNGGTTPLTTQQKITGNWNGFLSVINYYENGVKIDSLTETYDITDEDFDFNADGNLYYSVAGTPQDTFSWSLIDNSSLLIDSTTFSIDKIKLLEFYIRTSQDITDTASGLTLTVENYIELTK